MLLSMLLMCPTGVWAAGSGETTTQVPVWLCIPFAGLLLCIAVMPLIKAEWWEAHQPHVVLMWILLMVIPFAVVYGTGKATETVLECIVNDYLTFIVLLFGLFCAIAGTACRTIAACLVKFAESFFRVLIQVGWYLNNQSYVGHRGHSCCEETEHLCPSDGFWYLSEFLVSLHRELLHLLYSV